MTVGAPPAARIGATACGLLMAATAGISSPVPGLIAATLAAVAVVFGVAYRRVATLAVVLTVCTIVLSNPAPTLIAASGLSAAAYLVLRHAAAADAGLDTVSGPTLVGAVGFTLAGLVATSFPLRLPWLPLAAPLAVLGIYVVATRPFTVNRKVSPPETGS